MDEDLKAFCGKTMARFSRLVGAAESYGNKGKIHQSESQNPNKSYKNTPNLHWPD